MLAPLLIRADASIAIGTGHVMRCLALAQAWREAGGRALFVMARTLPSIQQRLIAEGIEIIPLDAAPGSAEDADCLVDFSREFAAPIVVDGYHFDSAYQQSVKEAQEKLLFLDDTGKAGPYYADLVLNQNLHAEESMYSQRQPYTQLLLGTRYTMLRRDFLALRETKQLTAPVARRLLISMGGSDPDNITAKAIEMLKGLEVPGWEAIAIVGRDSPHSMELADIVSRDNLPVQLVQNPDNMATLMRNVDLAITAGGTTIWELACMGVPVVAMSRGEQERLLLHAAAAQGIAIDVGPFHAIGAPELGQIVSSLAFDDARRSKMSAAGQTFVDGSGAARVVAALGGMHASERQASSGHRF